jgi:hypothetical protein
MARNDVVQLAFHRLRTVANEMLGTSIDEYVGSPLLAAHSAVLDGLLADLRSPAIAADATPASVKTRAHTASTSVSVSPVNTSGVTIDGVHATLLSSAPVFAMPTLSTRFGDVEGGVYERDLVCVCVVIVHICHRHVVHRSRRCRHLCHQRHLSTTKVTTSACYNGDRRSRCRRRCACRCRARLMCLAR